MLKALVPLGPCQNRAMGRWSLVGRGEELTYVVGQVLDPVSRGVLIAGAAGVGKTRLMVEALGQLDDCHVERATATRSAQPLPFGALAHLLPDHALADQADLFSVMRRKLRQRADGRPIVLAMDDAYLLDPRSAAFVHHLVTNDGAKAILTSRSGERAPDAISALYRHGVLARLDLQPISRIEFDELVERAVSGVVEGPTLDRLWTAAGGNVLYVRELILDALEAGTLARVDALWRWERGAGTAPRLRELVFDRIGQLDDHLLRLVQLLALGEPLDLTVVERLARSGAVEEGEHRGLLTVAASGRRAEVRLAHPLFGEAIQVILRTTERRRLCRELADALAATPLRRRGELLRLATWRLEAGEVMSTEMVVAASRAANALTDFELAERLARAMPSGDDTFDSRLQLGYALCGLGRFGEAEAVLAPLVEVVSTSDQVRADLADARVLALGPGQSRVEEGLQILLDAEAGVSTPGIRALLQTQRAALLAFAARFDEASRIGATALLLVDDDAARVRAVTSVGSALIMSGQIDRALQMNEDVFPIALRLQDRLPRGPMWVLSNRATALILAGRFDDVSELIVLILSMVRDDDRDTHFVIGVYQGRIALAQGHPATARRHLADALANGAQYGQGLYLHWCRALYAESCALSGMAITEGSDPPHYHEDDGRFLGAEVDERRALAWVTAAEGRHSDAVAELLTAADIARSRNQLVFELLVLCDLFRLGETSRVARAQELAARADGPWAAAIGRFADAINSGKAHDFEEAAVAFEGFGAELVAAELFHLASVRHEQAGIRTRALACRRRSTVLVDRCQGPWSPLIDQAAELVPLSRREREVAQMASSGRSNADIAESLHVSVRTVESHLYAAFAKLGVTNRAQLSEVLR